MLPFNEVDESLAYEVNVPMAKQLHYTSRAKYFDDDYAIAPRQRRSHREIEHVKYEPEYYSEDDYENFDSGVTDQYYDEMIGYGHNNPLDFTSESDFNDIEFNINEDVQFKLSTSDNYEGRDVDIGIMMPDSQPKQ